MVYVIIFACCWGASGDTIINIIGLLAAAGHATAGSSLTDQPYRVAASISDTTHGNANRTACS
ncbi:hypothetical protein PR003_g34117 [Phytophthora rubi]|uniref:Uncharacterized protein n=1 Tax=Phytophthora rubi TaxID=129364 RepID=A0A6A4AUP1_9STRA|nr:hypothetical protein PR002_g9259 [Phytophthora rubi]KAE9036931.1 hypothetical protein PR001_g8599 [Phytophthora rubi]KAE9261010.1 hypothetical protein PR003_g34117 [Phytophthora rubi]